MLDHIHIENYRLFKNLNIDKVGQVNLITGKNNTGKTTLLEVLRLHANQVSRFHFESSLLHILSSRGDLNGNPQEAFKSLFHNGDSNASADINHSLRIIYNDRPAELNVKSNGPDIVIQNTSFNNFYEDIASFIPAGFNLINARLWKKIDLTDDEDKVADILRIIEPSIVRVSINEAEGTAKVRLSNSKQPKPLKNFGEGMNRLLIIALGLVNAENNLLLIDEIDLGLHHSIQTLLWNVIFQKARELNVQVFATTHSSDCVQAFSTIANKPDFTGMGNYIRLQRSKKDGEIMAVDYDMEQLENSLDLNLETR